MAASCRRSSGTTSPALDKKLSPSLAAMLCGHTLISHTQPTNASDAWRSAPVRVVWCTHKKTHQTTTSRFRSRDAFEANVRCKPYSRSTGARISPNANALVSQGASTRVRGASSMAPRRSLQSKERPIPDPRENNPDSICGVTLASSPLASGVLYRIGSRLGEPSVHLSVLLSFSSIERRPLC
jgi:hypothetical protein